MRRLLRKLLRIFLWTMAGFACLFILVGIFAVNGDKPETTTVAQEAPAPENLPKVAKTPRGCASRVDVSGVTGIDVAKLVEVICGASVMVAVLDSAEVRNSMIGQQGEDLFAKRMAEVKAGKGGSDEETIYAPSAKGVRINFRARGVWASSNEKLKEKIEQYMAETYIALFSQPVPLWSVKIAALYPLADGKEGVVYGTQVLNREGRYGLAHCPRAGRSGI